MQNKPLVSIITPCFNSMNVIDRTIKSVVCQTIESWELIIIDDHSVDDSIINIQKWCEKDSRIRYLSLPANLGAARARNKGIELAKGHFIAFLDSDDVWYPDKLEKQIRFMLDNNISFSYTAYKKIDIDGNLLGIINVPQKLAYYDLLKKCEIGCLTAIYDIEKLGKIYMPDIYKRQDLGLWLKILKKIPYAYGINEVLAGYTVRNDSLSANKKSAALYTWRLYRNVENLPLIISLYYFSFYAINGILRTKFPGIARRIGVLR